MGAVACCELGIEGCVGRNARRNACHRPRVRHARSTCFDATTIGPVPTGRFPSLRNPVPAAQRASCKRRSRVSAPDRLPRSSARWGPGSLWRRPWPEGSTGVRALRAAPVWRCTESCSTRTQERMCSLVVPAVRPRSVTVLRIQRRLRHLPCDTKTPTTVACEELASVHDAIVSVRTRTCYLGSSRHGPARARRGALPANCPSYAAASMTRREARILL